MKLNPGSANIGQSFEKKESPLFYFFPAQTKPFGVGLISGAGTLNGSSLSGLVSGMMTGPGLVTGSVGAISGLIGFAIVLFVLSLVLYYPELNETMLRVPDKKVSLI